MANDVIIEHKHISPEGGDSKVHAPNPQDESFLVAKGSPRDNEKTLEEKQSQPSWNIENSLDHHN